MKGTQKQSTEEKSNTKAITLYGVVAVLLLIAFIIVIIKGVYINLSEGDEWLKIRDKNIYPQMLDISPTRGNIYDSNNKLLAASIPKYNVFMDFNSEGINYDSLAKYIEPLSILLSENFGNEIEGGKQKYSKAYYQKILTTAKNKAAQERENRKNATLTGKPLPKFTCRNVKLIPFEIDYLQLMELKLYPFFKYGKNRTGLKTEERTERLRPFGLTAGRTVGTIHPNQESGGRSGIELKYDTILRGEKGLKMGQRIGGHWFEDVIQKPIEGLDIQLTVNLDVQDIVERSLRDQLIETQAKSGCAILMEVETGEIKAISNLDIISEGKYGEGKPNAFSYMFEPGSTFKSITVLAALDDNIVTPETIIGGEFGQMQYGGRTIQDHDRHKGIDKTQMTVRTGMYNSSNVVAAKIVLKGYEDKPEKFVEKIRKMGLGQNLTWDVPLNGKEGTTHIRSPKDEGVNWYKTALPWMSFGYETQIPPIYMVMFYNAVANKGKMIKPFLVKSYMKNGHIEEEFKAELINEKIASTKAINDLRSILEGVVTDGTGKGAHSEIVSIAGKTGTAKLTRGGRYSNNYFVSFAGYFPADNPKYTCYVGIEEPKGIPSGGTMAGSVVKEIAEQVMLKDWRNIPISPTIDTTNVLLPKIHAGNMAEAIGVIKKLKIKYSADLSDSEWGSAIISEEKVLISQHLPTETDEMPNVVGMGLKDAIFISENLGLQVQTQGYGKVVSQSLKKGSKITPGTTLILKLEI